MIYQYMYSIYFPQDIMFNMMITKTFEMRDIKFIVGGDFNAKYPWWGS